MKVYMFHYVVPKMNYHHFDSNLFEEKIKELSSKYHIISYQEFVNAMNQNVKLNDNYIMLTFDDGTVDHYKYVYKILKKYNLSGLFFVPSCIFNKKVLDIQLIHKLVSLKNFNDVYNDLINKVKEINFDFDAISLIKTFDDNKSALFKQLLQYLLEEKDRKRILKYLVEKYNISVNVDDYYMSIDMIKKMKNANMYFGLHTSNHPRLAFLNKKQQENEIKENLNFMLSNDIVDEEMISIAYPYGSYNSDTLEVLKKLNIKYGFKVNLDGNTSDLEIGRIDCKFLKD